VSRIGIEINVQSGLGLSPFIEKTLNVPPKLILKKNFCSFGVEVFDSELLIKQEAESHLTGIDEIIRILSSRNIWVKWNAVEKITMEDEISTQKHGRRDKAIF
jgi:hypothetical protein